MGRVYAVGMERFAVGQSVESDTLEAETKNLSQADPERAFIILELIEVSNAIPVYFGVGTTALDKTGQLLKLNEPVKIFTQELISAICAATADALIIHQSFNYPQTVTQ